MSQILPDLKNALSGWGTENHYFYEVVNYSGKSVWIKFVINSENITDEYRAVCDRITKFYPPKSKNPDWIWHTHFRTSSVKIGDAVSQEKICLGLDACLNEIWQFERDLTQKLAVTT